MADGVILFSSPMIQKLRVGLKTQTRRGINPQPVMTETSGLSWKGLAYGQAISDKHAGTLRNFAQSAPGPYGKLGDRLKVREAIWVWCRQKENGLTATGRQKYKYVPHGSRSVFYVADHPEKPARTSYAEPNMMWRYRTGRYMPRWASRMTLEITEVRVERLQDITEADCTAEGASWEWNDLWWTPGSTALTDERNPAFDRSPKLNGPRGAYGMLWESINGCGTWEENPWVWVVTFKVIMDVATSEVGAGPGIPVLDRLVAERAARERVGCVTQGQVALP